MRLDDGPLRRVFLRLHPCYPHMVNRQHAMAKCPHMHRHCRGSALPSIVEKEMHKQADEIQRIESLDDENNAGYEKRGEPDKGDVVAIDAAENEGLSVVGLGDQRPMLPGKAQVNSAAQNDSLPLDAKEKKDDNH